MIAIDRRTRGKERVNRRIALVWALLCIIFLALGFSRIVEGQFPGPDDVLRLVQVRDLLNGQSWFDLHQYRIDPPGGTAMHWSRLVDIPLALIVAILSPIFGQNAAEMVAIIVVPLLLLGGILFFIGRLAWRLFGLEVAGFACLAIGLFAPIVMQLQPMRIDHHGWQILAVAAALWAIAHRHAAIGGGIAGFAMGVGLTISIELLPMAAAFGAVLTVRWLSDRDNRWWLVCYMQALALSLTALFFLTRGWTDLTQYCDAIAPAHMGFFLIAAVLTGAIAAARNVPNMLVILLLTGSAGLGLLFFALSAPTCVAAPFAQLDPVVRDLWYLRVMEGRPVWTQNLAIALPILLQLVFILAVTILLARSADKWMRQWWVEYVILLVASILGAMLVWRSAGFACVIAAIPVGWLTAKLFAVIRGRRGLGVKLAAACAVIIILLPSAPVDFVRAFNFDDDRGNQVAKSSVREAECDINAQARLLNTLPRGTIFAPLDLGPAILRWSHHSVVATGHHRANEAMADVINGFTLPPDVAEILIRDHNTRYVLVCTDVTEFSNYAAAEPGGLAGRLTANDIPAWLTPVKFDAPDQFRVYRVTPQ